MHDVDNLGAWLQLASGLFIVALGVFVGSIRSRTSANLAFATFAVSYGGMVAASNAALLAFDQPFWDAHALIDVPRAVLELIAAAGVIAMALLFPVPIRKTERRLLVVPLALMTPFLAYGAFAATYSSTTVSGWAVLFSFFVLVAALVGVHALWALRSAAAKSATTAQQMGFMAGALVLYSGFFAVAGPNSTRANSVLSPDPPVAGFYALLSFLLIVGAGLWLRASARGPAPRTARDVALLTLVAMLIGLVYTAFDLRIGGPGIARLAAVTVLAYAIVRHQLLGIDVKVRWTLSKGSLAAVFVTVFFVATEAAQEFFGGASGSHYVGILAAGALVFAIAPLSRLADRLAEKAVPPSSSTTPRRKSAQEDAYRASIRLALRGGITRREEVELARIAQAHGIGPVRALEIRSEEEEATTAENP